MAAAGGAAVAVSVTGFTSCSYYQKAKAALLGIQALRDDFRVEVVEHATRDEFRAWWFTFREFIGGCDASLAWLKQSFLAGSAVSRPPRITHANDVIVSAEEEKAGAAGSKYQYDVIVIGGGSGGLAFSKEAASLGAKVCCLDFVKPSWQGSTWGLGGTCVNVGCIPKKLMHTAALLGEAVQDAKAYGWKVTGGPAHLEHAEEGSEAAVVSLGGKVSSSIGGGAAGGDMMVEGSASSSSSSEDSPSGHDWATMVQAVQDHISSLNFGYRVSLREKAVDYKNALGTFKDAHTVELTDKKGKKSEVTARRIVIAVGGRPKPLDVPGGELAISSDDLFSLQKAPGKTLVIGASYVALECAGFLAGLGYSTTVMVRSILLRGFDQQIADMIGAHMEGHGTRFLRKTLPVKIDKTAEGRLQVFYKNAETGEESSELFDTVFVATGRTADTAKLNLAAAGVVADKDGKLQCEGEQTNVPHIYALGDVLAGRPELTPVAIAAGRLLAKRLYSTSKEGMDYERIPTTVFTPLEYGCIGLSEEDAIARYGEANVEVYHSSFTPLEWTVVHSRPQNACYAKIIVHKKDDNRVVGFHVLGPNAGEVTQGWACALRLGATYESFIYTIGIHPTLAEEFTTLSITKSSGDSADKGGC